MVADDNLNKLQIAGDVLKTIGNFVIGRRERESEPVITINNQSAVNQQDAFAEKRKPLHGDTGIELILVSPVVVLVTDDGDDDVVRIGKDRYRVVIKKIAVHIAAQWR